MINSARLTGLTGSVAKALNIPAPEKAEASLPEIDALVEHLSPSGRADRVLIYNPDAVAFWLFQKYTELFTPVMIRTNITIPMQAVFPPVTPVCFGTMYTGAMPAVHGIEKYEKPIIRIYTLFDAVARAGKKAALIAVADSSMAKIFLERPIDYFFAPTDQEVEQIALEKIAEDQYDLICVYHMDYDEWIHDTTPESEQAMAALNRHVQSFAVLSDAVKQHWAEHQTLIGFAPDHGLHETIMGVGDHFADIPADMNMVHFWGFYPAKA